MTYVYQLLIKNVRSVMSILNKLTNVKANYINRLDHIIAGKIYVSIYNFINKSKTRAQLIINLTSLNQTEYANKKQGFFNHT